MSNKKARAARKAESASQIGDPARAARQAKIDAARKSSAGRGVNYVLVAAIGSVLAIALVVGGAIFLEQRRKAESGVGTAVPAAAGGMGQGYVANKDVKLVENAPTMDFYEDFQCPACAQFESVMGATIRQLADEGKVKLVYHTKTIIDQNANTEHSLNMSNAAFCAADQGGFQKFHDSVFVNQPTEGQGWTNQQKRALAEQAGITGDKLDAWQTCVDDGKYNAYVKSVEDASQKANVTATPTIKLNGEDLPDGARANPEAFIAAIQAATK